jgi:hypothetical protein
MMSSGITRFSRPEERERSTLLRRRLGRERLCEEKP